MARRGDYTLVEMPTRVNGRPLPEVTVVDMRRELASGNRSIFSQHMQQRLSACFARGQQAMLFLNRRGYNTFVSCPQLRLRGAVRQVRREHDAAPAGRRGYRRAALPLLRRGAGSAKNLPRLRQWLYPLLRRGVRRRVGGKSCTACSPPLAAIRMDIDTTQKRDAHYRLLTAFREGKRRRSSARR